tara:strand:- start:3623 stop:4171 length:549 start_codon:yes stop_codon:yes gene_type:complete
MKKHKTCIDGAFLFEVKRHTDERGYFMETWNHQEFDLPPFVQDNQSRSKKGVLRGLHYQNEFKPQGKLVRCTQGAVYDVIVDLRKSSDTFGRWFGVDLNRPELMLWAPPGMAHGFYTYTDNAEFQYKVTNYYDPFSQRTLMWNDEELDISWPFEGEPILSEKDWSKGETFDKCEKFITDYRK